jgi:hypothetical protein
MSRAWTAFGRAAPIGLLAAATAAAAPAVWRTFDDDAAGRPPAGFAFHVARQPSPARWTVQRDEQNGLLVHEQDPEGHAAFALAVLDDPRPGGRTTASVRLRLTAGSRSAGLVWKLQDSDNYYLARLDLQKQDLGLYRVVHGNRVRIEGEDDLELDRVAWHALKIVHEGETIRVYLGGIRVLRARDRTFESDGAVGLWCTGDTTAQFDDLRVEEGRGDAGSRRGR